MEGPETNVIARPLSEIAFTALSSSWQFSLVEQWLQLCSFIWSSMPDRALMVSLLSALFFPATNPTNQLIEEAAPLCLQRSAIKSSGRCEYAR